MLKQQFVTSKVGIPSITLNFDFAFEHASKNVPQSKEMSNTQEAGAESITCELMVASQEIALQKIFAEVDYED